MNSAEAHGHLRNAAGCSERIGKRLRASRREGSVGRANRRGSNLLGTEQPVP